MAENYRILGAVPEVPIYVSMSGAVNSTTAISGAVSVTGTVVVSGTIAVTGTIFQEEAFAATNSSNSLLQYATPFTVANRGFESASVVKASAGKLYEVLISNPSAIPVYLQFFDRTSTPEGGALPTGSYRVEPSGSLSIDYRSGKPFPVGICVGMSVGYSAFTGTASGSFEVFYK